MSMRKSSILVINMTLKLHDRAIESAHMKIKYPCDQCDFKATRQGDVKRHIELVNQLINRSGSVFDTVVKDQQHIMYNGYSSLLC